MRKILVLIFTLLSSSLLSSVYSLGFRRKENEDVKNCVSLSLYNCGDTTSQRKFTHESHASHYSCTNGYKHAIVQKETIEIILDSMQVSEISSLWNRVDKEREQKLQVIKAESVYLDSIDGYSIKDKYIKLFLLIRYLDKQGDVDMQSHQYYIYYISKDKDLYYLYREEAPSRSSAYSLKEFPKLKQTIDIIKE